TAQASPAAPPPPAAAPVAVRALFEKHKLLGFFAWDCSKPASEANPYFAHRALDNDHVQRDLLTSATVRQWVAVIDKAVEVKPNEIAGSGTITGRVGGRDYDNKPTTGVWRIEPNRLLQWEATVDGQKVIDGGRYTNGNQVP